MKQCPLIQDLLPLYLDDTLSRESRAAVETHLAECDDCRLALAALRTGAPDLAHSAPGPAATPSEEARFLTRLKRQVGTVIGLALMLLVVSAFAANQIGRWQADKAYGEKLKNRTQEEAAALKVMAEGSPDPLARLKAHGVALDATAAHSGDTLTINYEVRTTAPVERVVPFSRGHTPLPRLYDPATGKDVGLARTWGAELTPGKPLKGHLEFQGASAVPKGAEATLPYLLLYIQPEQALQWEIDRPDLEGDVRIGQRFTADGVEFEVERVRFSGREAQIDYRQLTDPDSVGLYLLSFSLNDRMGTTMGADPTGLDELPDPLRPTQRFDFVPSLSKHWLVKLQSVVLAVPGPAIPVEVK